MSYISQEFNPALKVTDVGTSRVLNSSTITSGIDKTFYEYLEIKTNKAALGTNIRELELICSNGYATDTMVWPRITGKGNVGLFVPSGAAAPTWAAYMEGAIYFDTATHKLMVATNAAWVVAGSQS
jgi:hypothetical protein